jgi:hypothetical protein
MPTYRMPPQSAKLTSRLNRRCSNPLAWANLCWVVASTLAFWALGIDRPAPRALRSEGGHQRVSPHLVGDDGAPPRRRARDPPPFGCTALEREDKDSTSGKDWRREVNERGGA